MFTPSYIDRVQGYLYFGLPFWPNLLGLLDLTFFLQDFLTVVRNLNLKN